MLKLHPSRSLIVGVLLIGLCLGQTARASYPIPEENIGSGTIGFVDYAARTITVNGRSYPIPFKVAVAGAQNFEGLQSGMQVQYIMSGPVNEATSIITTVIVLPAKPRP